MTCFACPHIGCAFNSNSNHGIETHVSMVHRRALHVGTGDNAPKRRRLPLTVPRSLMGCGSRLPIDCVTQAAVGLTSAVNQDNSTLTDLPIHLPETYTPVLDLECNSANGQNLLTSDSSMYAICNEFLTLSRAAGEKRCDEFLATMRNHQESVSEFMEQFHTIHDIKQRRRIELSDSLTKQGFVEHKRRSASEMSYAVYCRDPLHVIREQVRLTPTSDIIIRYIPSEEYSHPLNSGIGRNVLPLAEDYIQRHTNNDVRWHSIHSDGEQSCIGCLQLFSDKSQTSLSAGAFKFYPIHITLLNFTETTRRKHICDGRTVFAYLPVNFSRCDCSAEADPDQCKCDNKQKKFKRVDFLQSLHESIHFALQPLLRTALTGISALTSERFHIRLHFIISSYLCDTPEAEDLLAVKRGTQCESPCHVCLVRKENLPFSCTATARSVHETEIMLSKLKQQTPGIDEEFQRKSMLSIPPLLSTFPMMSIHSSVDLYTLFRFEPMHNLSLGISKLLKECCVLMLKDSERTSPAMCTMTGVPRPFNFIRKEVLHTLNKLLACIQRSSSGYGLQVDFSKGETSGRLSGFFTEDGVIGMLQAKHFDTVDMVAPFLGAIVDMCCGSEEKTPVTKTYVAYTDLSDFIFRRRLHPSWDEEELGTLGEKINSFKTLARDTFGVYQASNMGTSKWHALEHLVGNLRDLGGIQYMHGGLYEQSHKNFKEDYKLTSKRIHSAMRETLERQEERALLSKYSQDLEAVGQNKCKVKAVKEDGAALVSSGPSMTLNCVEIARRMIIGEGTEQDIGDDIQKGQWNVALNLVNTIGNDGTGSFLHMMYDKLGDNGYANSDARHCTIHVVASAYVSAIYPPTLADYHVGTSVYIPRQSQRQMQRIVAKDAFYGKCDRHDSVMVESDERHEGFPTDKYLSVWFGKALTFVRLPPVTRNGMGKETDRDRYSALDTETTCREFCFLQFYEVLGEEKLSVDEMDSTLKCIRLRWHRTQGNNIYSSGKEFGLVPVECIKGKVHVVRADFAMPIIGNHVRKKKEVESLRDGEDGWASHIFYLNRFYHGEGEVYDELGGNEQ